MIALLFPNSEVRHMRGLDIEINLPHQEVSSAVPSMSARNKTRDKGASLWLLTPF